MNLAFLEIQAIVPPLNDDVHREVRVAATSDLEVEVEIAVERNKHFLDDKIRTKIAERFRSSLTGPLPVVFD